MKVDYDRVKDKFAEYTSHYDITNPKVELKVNHTYRVAQVALEIAKSLKLSQEDCDEAWLIGMLHDVGRFEQIRRFNTFFDSKCIPHAEIGLEVLFDEGKISEYIDDTSENEIIRTAIAYHSVYILPENLSERELLFCNILRDADKVDILRVQVDTPLEDIYDVTTRELRESLVTKEVMDAFLEEHTVLRSLKKTAVDHVVGHISLIYGLVYDKSVEIVKDQDYISLLLNYQSDNPNTIKQFEIISEHMKAYLRQKTGTAFLK